MIQKRAIFPDKTTRKRVFWDPVITVWQRPYAYDGAIMHIPNAKIWIHEKRGFSWIQIWRKCTKASTFWCFSESVVLSGKVGRKWAGCKSRPNGRCGWSYAKTTLVQKPLIINGTAIVSRVVVRSQQCFVVLEFRGVRISIPATRGRHKKRSSPSSTARHLWWETPYLRFCAWRCKIHALRRLGR